MPGEIACVVTKAAIEALTLTLAAEVAGRGITVNAIDPGATDTGWMEDDLRDHIAARTYLGRIGLPTDAIISSVFWPGARRADHRADHPLSRRGVTLPPAVTAISPTEWMPAARHAQAAGGGGSSLPPNRESTPPR